MNYQEIQKLFGEPLQHVPKPRVPYKLKTWHIIIGGAAISLMVLGGIKLHEYIDDFFHKEPKKR
jgi:hypothetical protein